MKRTLIAAFLLALTLSAVAQVIPREIDLGSVDPGATASATIVVTNDSDAELAMSFLTSDPSLVLEPETLDLAAGEEGAVQLRLTAGEEPGPVLRLVTVLYDDAAMEPDVVAVRARVAGEAALGGAASADEPADAVKPAGLTRGVLTVDIYMDVSCPSCRELAYETIPAITDGADLRLELVRRDIMDPEATADIMTRLARLGLELDELPVAFVLTDGSSDPVVFQGFEGIERGIETLVHEGGVAVQGGEPGETAVRVFSVGAIIGAGLMDGINPCAFSTMLFLISMLALVGRSRREILIIGMIYSATVFIGYLAAGFGLFASVRALMVFPVVVQALRWILVTVLGVLAVLSVRDGVLAKQGRTKEMALQLPDRMKRRVHDVVRSGTRKASLVGGTIVLGIGVTIFEFSCTGQVYVPVIMHLARTGSARALWLLVVYNVAFIAPLLVVFGLAFAGISMKSLGSVFERHLATVKFGLAAVFAGLAVMTIVL